MTIATAQIDQWAEMKSAAANDELTTWSGRLIQYLAKGIALDSATLRRHTLAQTTSDLWARVYDAAEDRSMIDALRYVLRRVDTAPLETGPASSTDDFTRALSATEQDAFRTWRRETVALIVASES
jgi:hypothetical protein